MRTGRLDNRVLSGWLLLAAVLIAGACTSSTQAVGDGASSGASSNAVPDLVPGETADFGPAPDVPTGDLDPELVELLDQLDSSFSLGLAAITIGFDAEDLDRIVELGDTRTLWIMADLLGFPLEGRLTSSEVVRAFESLSGTDISSRGNAGTNATNHLIAWDIPAFPGYLQVKRALYTTIYPEWAPFFVADADVDWRHVRWGGVGIDDRLLGNNDRCVRGCIPALDDPAVTIAADGDWYPDDALVFGIEVDGAFRAYPKNMMETHEMVNDTLAGRRIAVPYCTLCGSAQAYLIDELPDGALPEDELPIMRTTGLLIRSNKMMFELRTRSLVDTFLGKATSGPLQGQRFEQLSVATSSWAAWRDAHPDTTILAEDGGIGRSYRADPLDGRDDNGPIFPIGEADNRIPAQEPILGIKTGDGRLVAVHVAIARATLQNGSSITIDDLTIELAGDGVRAVRSDGSDPGGHQAFWFAWSQFHPSTILWPVDFGT